MLLNQCRWCGITKIGTDFLNHERISQYLYLWERIVILTVQWQSSRCTPKRNTLKGCMLAYSNRIALKQNVGLVYWKVFFLLNPSLKHSHLLYLGGVVEDMSTDVNCYTEFCNSKEGINSNACNTGQVRLFNVNESESLGPYMARYLGGKFYRYSLIHPVNSVSH